MEEEDDLEYLGDSIINDRNEYTSGSNQFRPISTYIDGEQIVYPGQSQVSDRWGNEVYIPDTDTTSAGVAYEQRQQSISDSLLPGNYPDYTQSNNVIYAQTGKEADAFIRRGKLVEDARRDRSGRFARKAYQLNDGQQTEVGNIIRDQIIENYKRLIGNGSGGEQTGQLLKAIEGMEPRVRNIDGGFEITLKLLDLPGVQRSISKDDRSTYTTGYYGPRVFGGRVGITPTSKIGKNPFMRFVQNGVWISTLTVKPSTPKPVFELSSEQRSMIGQKIKQLMGE